MALFFKLETKKESWDLIKKYFPVYEDKLTQYKEVIERYLSGSQILLDAGCGSGKETVINYKEKAKLAIGIDLSPEIENNNTLHKKIVGSVYEIPLDNNSVDIIVTQSLIEHLEKPERLFQEASRVLKPGGIFILMTPNLMGWRSFISKCTPFWFHVIMNKKLYGVNKKDVFPTHYKANTISKLKKLLKNNDFTIIDQYFYEPSPKTLTFSLAATYLEIMYTRIMRKYNFLKTLREAIIIVAKKA
jgi:SAM-dependent methyltransferase